VTDLGALVADASAEDLPSLIGQLEAAKAAAWARLALAQWTAAQRIEPRDDNLTVSEAAKRLGVSAQWLYGNAGKLPFMRRIGRRVLCSARGLEQWNGRQGA